MEYYLRSIRKNLPLSKQEERELITKAKEGDRHAYEKLINSNLRFVVMIAKKYQNKGLPLEDLIAEGNIGLLKAFEHFDINKNIKFITYAVWWIRESILKALNEHSRLIRIPVSKLNSLNQALKTQAQVEQNENREIDLTELENIDSGSIYDTIALQSIIELNYPETDDQDDLTEIISDNTDLDINLENFDTVLDEILSIYSEKDIDILKSYFGIHTEPQTLKTLGDKYNLTKEGIRQIKNHIIEKLKRRTNIKDLYDYT